LSDLGQLIVGNGAQTISHLADPDTDRYGGAKSWNEATKAGREGTDFLRRYTPGTSLWYTRLAIERNFFDQIQMLVDPGYEESWKARERGRVERGSPSWWSPGETAPGRAPDYENALGGDQ
jgi:hypothetical protein